MSDVSFVYFDLDDTLLDHRAAEQSALGCLHDETPDLAAVGREHLLRTYHDVNVRVWRQYAAAELDKASAKRARFARLLEALAVQGPDPDALSSRYMDLYGMGWRYRTGAKDVFLSIADRLPVGILTNGFVEQQRAKLRQFPELDERSEAVVISEEVGLMKPDPRLFDHAARLVDTEPARILYIGDSLHSDVRGGIDAGWQVGWLDGRPSEAPDGAFCFNRWDTLIERLGLI